MDEKQLEKLLQSAAAKLNMSPDQLKKAATSGDVNSILSHMDKGSAEKVQSALNDKQFTDNLLNTLKNQKK